MNINPIAPLAINPSIYEKQSILSTHNASDNLPVNFGPKMLSGPIPSTQISSNLDLQKLSFGNSADNYFNLGINRQIYSPSALSETKYINFNQEDLRAISFETILDQPHSINSLFTDEVKKLVEDLVEMQKHKLTLTAKDSVNDTVSNAQFYDSGILSSDKHSISPNQISLPLNHLIGDMKGDQIFSKEPRKKNENQRTKQSLDDQSEQPYSKGKEKSSKSIMKHLILTFGRRLESFSKALIEVSN